jgi:hypothetical protein
MRTARWLSWVALGLVALTLLAALALLVSSLALYRGYVPSPAGVEPALRPAGAASALDWIAREHVAAVAVVVLAVLAAAACLLVAVTRGGIAWVVALVGALVAACGAIASLATRTAVQWDQLALWAVTAGADVKGYQAATGGDVVRFVVVDGREVAPLDYRLVLGVHMGGATVAVVVLVVALAAAVTWGVDQPVWRQTKAASSSTASTASGNAG